MRAATRAPALVAACPKCKADSSVIDSRPTEQHIRRRRRCDKCQHRWTTVEVDETEFVAHQNKLKDIRTIHRIADELIGIATEHTEEMP